MKTALLALTLAIPGVSAAAAQGPDPWRVLAERDVEAAHRILQEDHPATTPEAGDTGFRQRLAAAYAEARGRAARVTSFEGLAATLAGFATALGDKHIRARTLLNPPTLDWAGLLVVRRGGSWIVADEERQDAEPSLLGAQLTRCDGVAADRLAEQRLGGFRAIWSVPAQQVAVAPLLLVDDGNPLLARPARCTFVLNGEQRETALRWRTIARAAVAPRINAAVKAGAPGFGVRQSGAGWWIALQSLSDQAIPVVAAVRARAEEMRRGSFVVLDMRGNGGGNSIYGDQIAEALLGPAATSGTRGETESCNPVWRVSPRNLATLAGVARGAGERMGPDAAVFWQRQHERALAARAAGQALSGPAECGVPSAPTHEARALPAGSLFTGKLVVLTDHLCFSSCLLVTDRLRNLGALHVGATNDAATRYFEVREDRLPSGVMAFSTLQALAPASPYQIGPFTPDRLFEGDISDTAMLERWVAELVASPVG